MSARAAGTGLAASTNWVSLSTLKMGTANKQMINFCVSLMVPPMLEAITFGTCECFVSALDLTNPPDIFFTAFMLLGVAYAIWILPETRNVSLEAMDKIFSAQDSTRDAATMQRIMQRLESEAGIRSGQRESDDFESKREIEATESV